MSLLSMVWDGIKGLVRALILELIAPVKSYLLGKILDVCALFNPVKTAWENFKTVGLPKIWDAVNPLKSAWDHFRTVTLPELQKSILKASGTVIQHIYNTVNNISNYVTNTYRYVTEQIYNAYNTVTQYVTNTYRYVTENVYNTVNNTYQYITNVVGVTESWVRSYVTGLIPVDFLKDPLGYLGAAFLRFIEPWIHNVLTSVAEGIEAGTKEAEEEMYGG